MGLCWLVTAIPNPHNKAPIPRWVGLADVLTTFTAAKPLSKLHTAFVPAVVAATATESEDEIVIGDDLYEAQTEFYDKIPETFTTEIILKVVSSALHAFRIAKAV